MPDGLCGFVIAPWSTGEQPPASAERKRSTAARGGKRPGPWPKYEPVRNVLLMRMYPLLLQGRAVDFHHHVSCAAPTVKSLRGPAKVARIRATCPDENMNMALSST